MQIRYHKRFEKQFKKLPLPLQQKTLSTIKIFSENPIDSRLRNHKLKGKLKGLNAISVTSDMRLIFREEDNYTTVTFLNVGTHNQVY